MIDVLPTKPSERKAVAVRMVKQAGVRFTRQRRLILENLIVSRDHPTASELFQRITKSSGHMSLATVYNCLETMVRAGVVNQLRFDGGPSRYCPNLVPHVHVLDDKSNRVIDVRLKPDVRLEEIFELPEGVVVHSMDACLHGTIPNQRHSHARK